MPARDLKQLENRLNYKFDNISYLDTALTHKSYSNDMKINKVESYERSEYLGDAILEYIVSEYLYKEYPDYTEGQLTKLRASLVCEFTLSQVSRDIGYGDYVRLSKGEELTGGRNRSSIMCDLFEAVLGAIYLDGGIEPAKKYVRTFLLNDIEGKMLFYDAKSTLQEYAQSRGSVLEYNLISESGPDHNKEYCSEVRLDGEQLAVAKGHSKKASEQTAAYNALLTINKKQD